mgnify:FL=1
MEENKIEAIKKYANEENISCGLSDDVIIEIVHAFKDIIIEFINKRYVNHN